MSSLIAPNGTALGIKKPDMPAPSTTETGPRCGNCAFGRPVNGQTAIIECHGLPPTPILMGFQQDALGRPNPNIALMFPRVPANEARCALWQEAQGSALLNSETQGNG